ncbi:MAG: class I SAM-dependent methyltransferase [Cyanobacteriota bacterium]|nr:class I SAM-dependent methyltransferase [Cyanobacteriota bacterium]
MTDLALQLFLQDQVRVPQQFNPTIHEQDEMYLFALQNHKFPEKARIRYHFNGRRIFDAVRQVVQWKFQGFNSIHSFLDFASGYGRFTRFLLQEMNPQQVWISDIYENAVKFQQDTFGVQGILSSVNPADYQLHQTFDCILACSFFSHIPEKTFTAWMKTLYNLLTPEGIFLFSVHDRDLLSAESQIQSDQLLFIPQSESLSLDVNEYGTSYVGEEFVKKTVENISKGEAFCYRIPKGICRYQDLYVIGKPPTLELSNLNFYHHPWGRLEYINLDSEGVLTLRGWASELNINSKIESILVFVNGELIQQAKPILDAESSSEYSWSMQINVPNLSTQDVILIKAINSNGLEWVFEAAMLEILQAAM